MMMIQQQPTAVVTLLLLLLLLIGVAAEASVKPASWSAAAAPVAITPALLPPVSSQPGAFTGGPTLTPQHSGGIPDNPADDHDRPSSSSTRVAAAALVAPAPGTASDTAADADAAAPNDDGELPLNIVRSLSNDMAFALIYGQQQQRPQQQQQTNKAPAKSAGRRRLASANAAPNAAVMTTAATAGYGPDSFSASAALRAARAAQHAELERRLFGGLELGPASPAAWGTR
jgi:hypothetical protein